MKTLNFEETLALIGLVDKQRNYYYSRDNPNEKALSLLADIAVKLAEHLHQSAVSAAKQ